MFGKGNAPDEVATPVRGKRNPKRDAVHFKQSIFANKLLADKLYITTEYETFYDSSNGDRKADYETKLAAHYDAMSTFDSGYFRKSTPLDAMEKYIIGTTEDKYEFLAQNGPLLTVLLKPDSDDYFHFLNYNHRSRQRKEAFRRIVVGLWSQENALPLADAMIALFEDRLISPYLASFKVLLSFNPTKPRPESEPLKGDKAVIYYHADLSDLSTDRVGNTIVRAIDGAVPTSRRDARFAPFYEEIAQGIAWADETGQASFTQVRDDVISRVVRANQNVKDEEEFYELVLAELEEDNVNPLATHRYFALTDTPPAPALT